jgi:hypothetical protein
MHSDEQEIDGTQHTSGLPTPVAERPGGPSWHVPALSCRSGDVGAAKLLVTTLASMDYRRFYFFDGDEHDRCPAPCDGRVQKRTSRDGKGRRAPYLVDR